MSFLDIIERAKAYLERQHRMSLRALRREFDLDDEAVEELVEELVQVQKVAVLDGKTLAWGSLSDSPTPAGAPETPAAATARSEEVAAFPQAPDAERRQLTVMFCDLVGSTALSEQLDPEDLREVVRAYQESCAGVIQRFEGHLAKYLGDGLLVYFGYPVAHEDDAERAVRSGLGIIDDMQQLNARLEEERGLRLAVRVGIHTGLVVAGDMGAGEQPEHLAIVGETPNIAARLQGLAESDTVVISGATMRLIAGVFVTKDLGTTRIKGITEPLQVHRVLQPSGVRSRLEVSGQLTPFVGRKTELGVLCDAWERVVEGTGQTVLVQGEAGLGKSRLCYELREHLTGEPHTWLECHCSPYTAGTAFRPVTELVGQALTFAASDTPAEKLGKLGAGLTRGGFTADEAVPLLAEWLDLPESAGYVPVAMSPDLKRRMTLETLAAWNLKLGELQPMVVLVEDLHWCDPSSLELLGQLVAQSATSGVLLVGTARPEFASPWQARSNLQTLTLGRLPKRQVRELIGGVTTGRALPKEVVEQLVARADGVPLYAEELTQTVVEADGEATVTAIPVTLQDSLMARLDRLSSAKEVAQRASVLGREFCYPLLAATAEIGEGALRQGLERLVEAELLFVRGQPPEANYTFKHALVQEAAYESLLKRTRQQLHARIAHVLEEQFPERVGSNPEELARHFDEGGLVEKALDYYQHAGDHARARFANAEAIAHMQRGVQLTGVLTEGSKRDARELEFHLRLGPTHVVAHGYAHEDSGRSWERARELCEKVGSPAQLAVALRGLSVFHYIRSELSVALELAEQVLALARESGNDGDLVAAHTAIANPCYWLGRFRDCLEGCSAALEIYEPKRHEALALVYGTDLGVVAYGYSCWALVSLGYPERAVAQAKVMVKHARTLTNPFDLAYALAYASFVYTLFQDWDNCIAHAGESIELSEKYNFPFSLGVSKIFGALALACTTGRDMLAALEEGLTQLAGAGQQVGVPALLWILARIHQEAGRPTDALRAVDAASDASARGEQPFFDAELLRLKGVLLVANTEAEAESYFRRGLEVARSQEAKLFELHTATNLALLWRQQDKTAEARDLLQPVYNWFTEGFDTQPLKDAKALLGELK